MRRTLRYVVEDDGGTVGEFLRAQGFSRHVLREIKEGSGGIFLDGHLARMKDGLRPGDCLTVELAEDAPSANIVPVPMDLVIVYEDEDLVVIDKPENMPVHPSAGNYENTLANGLAHYYKERGEAFVFRCITRLDRDTTGLLVVAKHALSAALLSEMGKNRQIRRVYQAVVSGETPKEGTIDAPIARKEGSVLERCVDFSRGERAVTHFRRLAYANRCSLVELELQTGRTHQIRVHMKYLGYPLIGDFLYHPDDRRMNRQALHSCRLSFRHPITGEAMEFTSRPPWEWPLCGLSSDGSARGQKKERKSDG